MTWSPGRRRRGSPAGNPLSFLRVAPGGDRPALPTRPPRPTGLRAGSREPRPARRRGRPCPRGPRRRSICTGWRTGSARSSAWLACVHVNDYERGVIRKHETTRPDKEDDRTRHTLALQAHAEPVLLLYRDARRDRSTRSRRDGAGAAASTSGAGVRHTVWAVPEPAPWVEAFRAVGRALRGRWPPSLRRAPRARRVSSGGAKRSPRRMMRARTGSWPCSSRRASCASCPTTGWSGTSDGGPAPRCCERLARLGERQRRARRARTVESAARSACTWIGAGIAWRCRPRRSTPATRSAPSDVSLLQERVLEPILGIRDPRTDPADRLRGRHPGHRRARAPRRLGRRRARRSPCTRPRSSS